MKGNNSANQQQVFSIYKELKQMISIILKFYEMDLKKKRWLDKGHSTQV